MSNPTTVLRLCCDVVAVVTTATTYDFEIGVIDKIYKSLVEPILVFGRLHFPKTMMGISQDL